MDLKKVGLGSLLLLVSSTILVATGSVGSPIALFGLSVAPLALAAAAYLASSVGVGRPV